MSQWDCAHVPLYRLHSHRKLRRKKGQAHQLHHSTAQNRSKGQTSRAVMRASSDAKWPWPSGLWERPMQNIQQIRNAGGIPGERGQHQSCTPLLPPAQQASSLQNRHPFVSARSERSLGGVWHKKKGGGSEGGGGGGDGLAGTPLLPGSPYGPRRRRAENFEKS